MSILTECCAVKLPPSCRFPPLREGKRERGAGAVSRFARGTARGAPTWFPCGQGEPQGAGKGTSVRHRIAEAGATFPAQAWTGRRAFLPSPPVSPSPALRERGNALQGALPCAPTPLSHCVGEGLGVRAKKRARLHTVNSSDVPLSDLKEGVCSVVDSMRR
jgi:hypothetical protein